MVNSTNTTKRENTKTEAAKNTNVTMSFVMRMHFVEDVVVHVRLHVA
jgi:hypothetical protein